MVMITLYAKQPFDNILIGLSDKCSCLFDHINSK